MMVLMKFVLVTLSTQANVDSFKKNRLFILLNYCYRKTVMRGWNDRSQKYVSGYFIEICKAKC